MIEPIEGRERLTLPGLLRMRTSSTVDCSAIRYIYMGWLRQAWHKCAQHCFCTLASPCSSTWRHLSLAAPRQIGAVPLCSSPNNGKTPQIFELATISD